MSGRETIIAGTPVARPRYELPPPPKPSVALAVVSLTVAAVAAIVTLLVKLWVPAVFTEFAGQLLTNGDVPIVLAGVSLFITLPTVLSLWLAHIALGPEREVPRGGRAIAGAALGVGYLSAALWLTRVTLALLWPQATGSEYGTFLLSLLYWT